MAGHDAFDLTRLDRIERRLQALEDAEAIRNLKSRYVAPCDDNYDAMMRTGSLRSLRRMQPGKAQVSVGTKAATRSAGFFRVQPGSSHSLSITA